jgi:hypothetical protein
MCPLYGYTTDTPYANLTFILCTLIPRLTLALQFNSWAKVLKEAKNIKEVNEPFLWKKVVQVWREEKLEEGERRRSRRTKV